MAQNKKLLVADDSLTIQKVIRLALSNEGYEIQTVSDGNDAIQQISLFRPDIVLIDVSLPGKTAFEVKKTINQQGDFNDVRFVLMSSAFEKVDEVEAAKTEFHGRLTKPFDPAHLRQILSDMMAQVKAKRTEQKPVIAPVTAIAPEMPEIREIPEIREMPDITEDPVPSISLKFDDELTLPPPTPSHSSISLTPPNEFPFDDIDSPIKPSSEPVETADSDIKQLTESTIRMSGLADDFQWSVNDNSRKEEPQPKPFADISDFTTEFKIDPPPAPLETIQQPKAQEAAVMPVSTDDIEKILQKQFEETFTKMAQKLLPDIAERVIKTEISKLLNERV